MLVYLDQNHASRIAKSMRGQPSHEPFGELYAALRERRPLVPPSPFHVLETRGGYLLPTLQDLFAELSYGWWVRPYQEVVAAQAHRGGIDRADLVTREGDWQRPAQLEPLEDLFELVPEGHATRQQPGLVDAMAARFEIPAERAQRLPFFRLLAKLVTFRARDDERRSRASDLTDVVMAATVAPYVDVLATDRYLREMLGRVGHGGHVFSGRRPDVLALARWLRAVAR